MDKDRKKRIEGEVVRVRKGLPRTNKAVVLPKKLTWLKQSNLITLMSNDYGTLQLKILICAMEKIQDSIEDAIRGVEKGQLSLFKSNQSDVMINIQYSELDVSPGQYKNIRALANKLVTMPIEFDAKNPITGEDAWGYAGLIKRVYIPKAWSKSFTLVFDREIAEIFVNIDKGFTRFIKEIAMKADSKYTIRMYLLISSWKDKGGFQIYTDHFKKWLKIENKYADFKDLYKRIIRPVYEELHEKANCWFEVAEVYTPGENQPYKLRFKVIKAILTKKEEETLESNKKQIANLCSSYLKMKPEHLDKIIPFVTLNNYQTIAEKILYLNEYLRENWKSVTHIPEYCVTAIKAVIEIPGIVGEELEEEVSA